MHSRLTLAMQNHKMAAKTLPDYILRYSFKDDGGLLNEVTFRCVCTELKGNKLLSNCREQNRSVSFDLEVVLRGRLSKLSETCVLFILYAYFWLLPKTLSTSQATYPVTPRCKTLPLGQ